jgi:hypothetical protein
MNFGNNIKCVAGLSMLAAMFILNGCNKEEFDEMEADLTKEVKIESFSVDGALRVDLNEADKTIEATFPGGMDVSSVVPEFTVTEGAVVSPEPGTAIDMRVPQTFIVKNGNVFGKYTVTANVLAVTAFLSHHASVNDITDDDEKAYAEWFFSTYDDEVSEFVSFESIKDGSADLSKYKTLTWYLDGDADESFNMPSIAVDADVLSAITAYHKSGGNLYLLGYAGRYLIELGRLPENKYFIEVGNGNGFESADAWGVGTAVLGKDESSHALFSGIPLTTNGARKTFPVIGPGWRENHNYVVIRIPEVYGMANDNAAAYDQFNEENGTRWLGVWDGIGDFFMAGIIEFEPKDDFQGRIIFQGIGGIEWNQDENGTINAAGENPYQQNVELLSSNAIAYLSLN